jgi:hypothetical protein|tara:strand:+ start:1059 stop:1811 length:753 start_codon:yes stop_codon:yes gene_type:complete
MTTGVLMYCFDTPDINYHRLAERCVAQIRKYLKLEITIVTNIETYKKFKPLGMINYKLVENSKTNTRPYRGKSVAWYNRERVQAYEHSPYETTILMDCDYFIFSNTLLELANTNFDMLLHDKVHDLTGKEMIIGTDEGTLPLVWATVTLFKKNANTKAIFDLIKHVQEYYPHYKNLYRIRYINYRNDYAFAIALHQLNLGSFIPTPMAMLADSVHILDSDDDGVVFKHNDCINFTSGQDIHALDKEWCNG